jgi:small acid-soluble spore protein H (minor)
MDIQRARKILESSQNIDVVYEGESVWIDDVNPDDNTARIHSLSTGKQMTVQLERLHEPQVN